MHNRFVLIATYFLKICSQQSDESKCAIFGNIFTYVLGEPWELPLNLIHRRFIARNETTFTYFDSGCRGTSFYLMQERFASAAKVATTNFKRNAVS